MDPLIARTSRCTAFGNFDFGLNANSRNQAAQIQQGGQSRVSETKTRRIIWAFQRDKRNRAKHAGTAGRVDAYGTSNIMIR